MAIPAGSWPAGTLVATSFDFPLSVLNPGDALYRPYSLTLTDYATGDRWNVETGVSRAGCVGCSYFKRVAQREAWCFNTPTDGSPAA